MKSLRHGLTLWLWTALGVVGVLSAVVAVLQAQREAQGDVDYQMQQVARILARETFAGQTSSQATDEPDLQPSVYVRHDRDDDLIVTVRDDQEKLLYASRTNRNVPGGVLPALKFRGFRTLDIGPESFRVFAAAARGRNIQVAQSMAVIREAESHIAIATLLPIALLLPILALVIGFAIRRQLTPLDKAAQAIANRPPLSLDLLPTEGIPAEVRPLVDEINRLLRRLTTAVEREQQFVTDAAHALRTPLTALQLQAEILEGGDSSEERSARLVELRAGIRRVIRLSEQLLSLARSQSETGPIAATSELDPSLQEIAALYESSARSKNVDLQVEASSGAMVYGNARRLSLIVGNLLDNALRFAPVGSHIRIRATGNGKIATIEVWDEGCGIAPEELEKVFERFYQSADNEGNGSGLGLATVAALVEQLGGQITLANRVDHQGLIATVLLRIAATAQTDASG